MMPQAARAAQWIVTYQTNGKDTGTDSSTYQPYTTPWLPTSPNGGGSAPSGYNSTQQTSHGTVTPILTWTLDSGETTLPPAPDPALAVVNVSITSTIDGNNGRGTSVCHTSASDSYSDHFATTTGGTVQTTSGTFSHLAQVSNAGGNKVVSLPPITLDAGCSTDGSNSGGSNIINIVTTPVNMVLAGATIGNGQYNILVGQGCTASLFAAAPGGRVYVNFTGYNWSVTGTTFQSWSPTTPAMPNAKPPTLANPNASYFVGGYGPATNATANWYWNDLKAAVETITCIATVTPPSGPSFPVTVTQIVNVKVPVWAAFGNGGYMQVNTKCTNQNGSLCLYAGPSTGQRGGINWSATSMTPSLFGKGALQLVQTAVPHESYWTGVKPSVEHDDPENNLDGLDSKYPYPGTLYAEGIAPYEAEDSPSIDLTSTIVSALMAHQFTDYLMYQPPSAGNGVQWISLATLAWSTNGNAAIPNSGNWADYKTQNGSDAAGTVIPSGTTATPFTKITVPNTFPTWTRINHFPDNVSFVVPKT